MGDPLVDLEALGVCFMIQLPHACGFDSHALTAEQARSVLWHRGVSRQLAAELRGCSVEVSTAYDVWIGEGKRCNARNADGARCSNACPFDGDASTFEIGVHDICGRHRNH